MTQDRIVAVALLTQRELDVLGTGLRRMFAVDDAGAFADLLAQLNRIELEATPAPPQGPGGPAAA